MGSIRGEQMATIAGLGARPGGVVGGAPDRRDQGRPDQHRHATTGDDGEVAHHAVEYAVLDRAGRLQLPREMTEPLGMRDLVRLEAEPDHIGVWPDRREST
jgi:hypothetical protein